MAAATHLARHGTMVFLVLLLVGLMAACTTTPEPAPVSPVPPALKPGDIQALFNQAVEELSSGIEDSPTRLLDRILAEQPAHRDAQVLRREIDAPKYIGPSVSYSIGPGESLSALAKRFLGNQYRFLTLARLNGIKVPKQLHAGMVIKIPGVASTLAPLMNKPGNAATNPAPNAGAPARASAAELETWRLEGRRCMALTQPDCALSAWTAILDVMPNEPEALRERDAARKLLDSLIAELRRQARDCDNSRDSDCARDRWKKLKTLLPNDPEASESLVRLG
jgi:hypothetical protein